jgi:hypothetical protein
VELPTIENRLGIIPLFRPPLPQSDWSFATDADDEVYLGRTVRHVRAKRREGWSRSQLTADSSGWPGIDEYECVVDDELRILLRLVGIVDGRHVTSIAAEEVRVNGDLPDDIFSFAPRSGARIAHLRGSG